MALHVFAEQDIVECRVPLKCPWREIDAFVNERLDWMVDAIRKFADQPKVVAPGYANGDMHLYLGQAYPLSLSKGRGSAELLGGRLCLSCQAPDEKESVQKQLFKFYRQQAEKLFPHRLAHCVEQFPRRVVPTGLRVRRMKARWGSCSSTGEICLNTMLVQKPELAIDMVIVHELCHLEHFNHTRAFYRLMDEAMPDWRVHEKLLANRGASPTQLTLF